MYMRKIFFVMLEKEKDLMRENFRLYYVLLRKRCGVSEGSALRLRLTGSTAQPCVRRRELLIG